MTVDATSTQGGEPGPEAGAAASTVADSGPTVGSAGSTTIGSPSTSGGGGNFPDPPASRVDTMSRRVHEWIPLAIVVVSVLAAVMGWRASLADEAATHTDELARQDLVLQQEVLLQKVQGVASDIRAFGPYEEYSILGDQLLKDGRRVSGPTGQLLAREGQGDVETARAMGSEFQYTSEYAPADPNNYGPGGTLDGSGAYKPGNPYPVAAAAVAAQSGDTELTSLEPNQLRADARAQRRRGVELIGLAALFIAGLVFLTLAAVSVRTRVLWLSACGMTVAVLGLALFPVVELA